MKIIFSILVMFVMSSSFFSCTPESLSETTELQDTVGEDSTDTEEETDD